MNRLLFPDYESLSQAAAKHIFELVCRKSDASICLATGSSPLRTYELLAENGSNNRDKFADVRIVKLDEWGGLPPDHEATCEYYLQKHIIQPLQISKDRYLSFKADAADSSSECSRVRTELEHIKPIDLSILGLGINGHLGFNEPAETLTPYAHVAALTAQTQQHTMVKGNAEKPNYGYTLGMADLLQSREIMILVNGKHKTDQLKRLLSGKIDPQFPASFLWLHPNTHLFTDIELDYF